MIDIKQRTKAQQIMRAQATEYRKKSKDFARWAAVKP
jgi:hypothetical protein